MMIRMRLNIVGFMLVCVSSTANSFEYHCIEWRAPENRMSLVCQGTVIPAIKARNFIPQSEHLSCTRGVDSHRRLPQSFDEENWQDIRKVDRQEAYGILRGLPVPEWSGFINYKTTLNWSWERCALVKDAFRCGSYTECKNKKRQDGTTIKECHDKPNTCFADVAVYEHVFCSDEELGYDVRFIRTDEAIWNPKIADFLDKLANGYDLLSGEEEVLTVSNSVGLFETSKLYPAATIRDPRNRYEITRLSGGLYASDPLVCHKDANDKVGFTVLAKERIRSRSGNGFSLPVSHDVETMESLVWQTAKATDGSLQNQGFPIFIIVQDYSAVALNEFSQDKMNIFKSIVLRVKLSDNSFFGQYLWQGSTVYIEEGEGVVQTLNAFSEDQKVRRSFLWQLALNGDIAIRKNIYRVSIPWFLFYPARLFVSEESLSYENQLRPNIEHTLELTVYHKGLSIYFQACEDDPDAFDCQWYAGFGWLSRTRYENGYFSGKSLNIPFTSNEKVNLRTWWPCIWAAVGLADDAVIVGLLSIILHKAFHHH